MNLSRLLLVLGFTCLTAQAIDDTTVSPEPAPAPANQPKDFKSLDADGDGRISLTEFIAPAAVHGAAKQAQAPVTGSAAADATHDNILSAGDSVEGRYSPEVFKNLDVNHDNFVSPEELTALFSNAHNISQP